MEPLEVLPGLILPPEELEIRTSRASGPGGQRVNKVETRVELRFDLVASRSLSDAQRARLLEVLAPRLTRDGLLSVVSQKHRERIRNLELARERLAEVLREALAERKERRKTRPTRGSQRRRVDAKRQRGQIKRWRRGQEE